MPDIPKHINRKVKASSMLETVVAMTLLLTILTLSFMALDRINRNVNPQVLYKAHLATATVLAKDDLLLEEIDKYEIEGYMINKKLTQVSNNYFRLELTVFNGTGHKIYSRKILKADEIIL